MQLTSFITLAALAGSSLAQLAANYYVYWVPAQDNVATRGFVISNYELFPTGDCPPLVPELETSSTDAIGVYYAHDTPDAANPKAYRDLASKPPFAFSPFTIRSPDMNSTLIIMNDGEPGEWQLGGGGASVTRIGECQAPSDKNAHCSDLGAPDAQLLFACTVD